MLMFCLEDCGLAPLLPLPLLRHCSTMSTAALTTAHLLSRLLLAETTESLRSTTDSFLTHHKHQNLTVSKQINKQ